jgi:hypothetical protein
MFCSCFVVLYIFIFVCTSVGLLPPGESPIAVMMMRMMIIIIINLLPITQRVHKEKFTFLKIKLLAK